MVTDKITSQLKKRFLQEIKKSKETGKERGFHICVEESGKLSAGRALMEHIFLEEEEYKLPKEWIKPLFEIEMIRLKRG